MPESANVSCTQPTEPFQTACELGGMNESQNSERKGPVTTASSYSSPIASYRVKRKSAYG